jgi:hypothetical protein
MPLTVFFSTSAEGRQRPACPISAVPQKMSLY